MLLLNFIWPCGYILAVMMIRGIFAVGKRNRKKGTAVFPSFIIKVMSLLTPIEQVEKLLTPLLTGDIFLVDMRIKPTNNFKIYLDADSGLGIEKCIKINRALYKIMEEMGLYPDGDFSLEVSSPGLGEPLKLHRQYIKNVGRDVEVTGTDGTVQEGNLLSATETAIEITYTEGKGKKAETKTRTIPIEDIKQTKVLIKF